MRLPECFTKISPVGETLEAVGAGEARLRQAAEQENDRLSVGTADGEGLSLWEVDYSLPHREGEESALRRAYIRAALAGGQTLTPERLRQMCVTLGGADRGEVEELFDQWAVAVTAITQGRLPQGTEVLAQALERLWPSHLELRLTARGDIAAPEALHTASHGGTMLEVAGDDVLRLASGSPRVLCGAVEVVLAG